MPKYEVIIDSMDQSASIKSAKARIRLAPGDQELTPIDMVQFPYNGKMIWKIFENGIIAPSPSVSNFQRGHRQTLAAWCLKVESDPALVGQSNLTANVSTPSQPVGQVSSNALDAANKRIEALEQQLEDFESKIKTLEEHLEISYDDEGEEEESEEG